MKKEKDLTRQTIKYYFAHAWKYPKSIIALCIAIPLTVFVNTVLPPIILSHVLNQLSTHDFVKNDVWGSFGPELIIYTIAALAGGAIGWRIIDSIVWYLESRVVRDIAQEVFDHLLKQSASFHANNFGGSLVSHNNKLLSSYVRISDTTIFQVLPFLFSLIFMSIVLGYHSLIYAAVLLSFSIVYLVTSFYVTKPIRRLGAKHSAYESAQTGVLADAVTNVMAIKSFAGTARENRRYSDATERTAKSLRLMGRYSQIQQGYFSVLMSLISSGALVMSVIAVVVYDANIAIVFLILNYTATIVGQLFQFGNGALRTYNRALSDASDMIKTLSITPEIQDPAQPEKVNIAAGAITFNHVTFQHDETDDALFDNLNLDIKPGEKVGFVGHSGSGKTTFTRLLLRFSDIQNGSITIDGQDITAITQDDLRRHIAYVPQEPLLFHRTISENISYGKDNADDTAIKLAATHSHAAEFIEMLPKGYETLVGERGVKLSGGQRQRIAIARAMLKDAPILVLDEATSALDSESEVLIQDALWKLMEGRTAIVIAHRLSTIQKMDRIIVLDNGTIVEQGSHKDLLKKKNGTYAKLWAHQSGGFIEE